MRGEVDLVGELRRGLVTGICGCDGDENGAFWAATQEEGKWIACASGGSGSVRGRVSEEKQRSATRCSWMSN